MLVQSDNLRPDQAVVMTHLVPIVVLASFVSITDLSSNQETATLDIFASLVPQGLTPKKNLMKNHRLIFVHVVDIVH